MKLAIVVDKTITDYAILKQAIKQSGFKNITEIVSGGAKGVDALATKYAKDNNLKLTEFLAKWEDITRKGADIKVNQFGKPYDRLAGFIRNEFIVDYSDAVIAIQKFGEPSPGTQNTIKLAKEKNVEIYIYEIKSENSDFEYKF